METHTSTLIEYGDLDKGQTAMARTVGYTAAIGAQLLLDGGGGKGGGVVVPLSPEWYVPILEGLKGEGIEMREKVVAGRA